MKHSSGTLSHNAFTLIELLVVVAIIAILAVVVVLTLNPAQLLAQSRDANRVSDMATINSAITLYQADQGNASIGSSSVAYLSIPDLTATSTAGTNCSGLGGNIATNTTYFDCSASSTYRAVNGTGWIPVNFNNISAGSLFSSLPVDPTNSTSSNLYYSYITNGTQFKVTSLPESQKYQAQLVTNPTAFMAGSNTSIAGGAWIAVPGNSTFGTSNFYVMKYDAGCSDGKGNAVNTPATSYNTYDNTTSCTGASRQITALPGAYPITNISETDAKTYCSSVGAHLMTNDEFMTISTNAVNQGSNWSNGSVGSGTVGRGNSDSSAALTASSDDTQGYNGIASGYQNDGIHKRTLTLSNGSVIWDISGNVWEWVQRSTNNQGDNQSGSYTTPSCSGSGWTWCEFGSTVVGSNNPITNYGAIPQLSIAPPNASWNSTNGMGRVYTNTGGNGGGSFLRGGSWNYGALDGPFSLNLGGGSTAVLSLLGFRCAR